MVRETARVLLTFIVCKWVLWWACGLFSATIEITNQVYHVLVFGNDVVSLESRPLILVYLYSRIQSIQEQIVEYDIKSK